MARWVGTARAGVTDSRDNPRRAPRRQSEPADRARQAASTARVGTVAPAVRPARRAPRAALALVRSVAHRGPAAQQPTTTGSPDRTADRVATGPTARAAAADQS